MGRSVSKFSIPLYQPWLQGNEKAYVNQCLDSTWISSRGEFVQKFEKAFSERIGGARSISVCNGTAAVHLALLAAGVQAGDEVIVPSLTYVASVNPLRYIGAEPIFVDVHPDTWQMDVSQVEKKITKKTKAILAVHLYGHPADMVALRALADQHGLVVVEDCAEALGATVGDKHVGTFGETSAFSFFGNKTMTTGEGGMVVVQAEGVEQLTRKLRGQGLVEGHYYWHDIVGYNYRMTNICAAIGLAQLEQLDSIWERKMAIAQRYIQELQGVDGIDCHVLKQEGMTHSFWLFSVLVSENIRDSVMNTLKAGGVETRPVFSPVHQMPMYNTQDSFPVTDRISKSGINLPSWPGLSTSQQQHVIDTLKSAVAQ